MLVVPKLPEAKSSSKHYGSICVMTSGGDAPGMNAAIRSVVRYSLNRKCRIFGAIRGFTGLLEGDIEELRPSSVANVIHRGGTVLKTSRCEAFLESEARKEAANILKRKKIDALIVIGGDGSFAGANEMEDETGFPTVGVPGTIDNDIFGTDETIGFNTAVNTGIEAIDRIRDTASSHDRLFLVEVMGRNSGFIAVQVGIGGGAETILVPEKEISLESICKSIDRGIKRGKTSSILVVAEGPNSGRAAQLSDQLSQKGYGPRVCILGHTQRGGSPTARDRFLGSTLGASAVQYLLAGKSNGFVGVKDEAVAWVPFQESLKKKKALPKEVLELSGVLAT